MNEYARKFSSYAELLAHNVRHASDILTHISKIQGTVSAILFVRTLQDGTVSICLGTEDAFATGQEAVTAVQNMVNKHHGKKPTNVPLQDHENN